jgi:calcium-activated chloride channel regulator 4
MKSLINYFFLLISITLPLVNASKPVQFINGGYRGLVVAIHSQVPESEQLISNLQELLKKSSFFLYEATDSRARFVEIEVIIPQTWSKKDEYELIAGSHYDKAHIRIGQTDPERGDEPYTFQPRGCGEPGEYIKLTDAFIEELDGRTKENFGPPGIQLFSFIYFSFYKLFHTLHRKAFYSRMGSL